MKPSEAIIPIIDLFAGPGGLGEGFSSYEESGKKPFKIRLSIEKNIFAHKTLLLRSFFRQFRDESIPEAYYQYLRKEITREDLFSKYPEKAELAQNEAWNAELGSPEFPHELVDSRIRKVLDESRSKKWLLIGGPPCQAYSTAGRSRIKWGNVKISYDEDHRHFLYKEYLRIISVHRPPIFVMENVKGLLSSEVNGSMTFPKILNDLKNPNDSLGKNGEEPLNYNIFSVTKSFDDPEKHEPVDFVVKFEEYGIPQARHRVILLGIRKDLDVRPEALKPKEPVCMWEAISDLPKVRSLLPKGQDTSEKWETVLKSVVNAEWLSDIPYDDVKYHLINVAKEFRNGLNLGGEFISIDSKPLFNPEWYHDANLCGVCNHTARRHMPEDLYRYLYAACFGEIYGQSPQIIDFPKPIWPKHNNILKALNGNMFSDRFRVQLKFKPSTTITSHISKDGHYFIHPDPYQCRSLTVREAARLQTFPDNYFFEGSRTQQYLQVGNAVPPLLARQIARTVFKLFI